MAKKTNRRGRGVLGRPGRRYEVTDEAWERIEPLLPKQSRGGRWNDHRTTVSGMVRVLNSGAPWRDMPERYGRWPSVFDRYRRWTREGLFDRILHRLHVQLDAGGRIDWSVFDVDGTNSRADRSAAGGGKNNRRNRTGRPRPGTIPRRLWHEASSCDRRSRFAIGCGDHGGPGARVETLRSRDGYRACDSPTSARRGCGRQGIQLRKNPGLVAAARDRSRHPTSDRSTAGEDRQEKVQTSQRDRALHRVAQVLPQNRNTLREASDALFEHHQARYDPTMYENPRSVRQNLGAVRKPVQCSGRPPRRP